MIEIGGTDGFYYIVKITGERNLTTTIYHYLWRDLAFHHAGEPLPDGKSFTEMFYYDTKGEVEETLLKWEATVP